MVIIGLLIAWALFRYQLLDLVPVSYQTLISNMRDALFVLDSRSCVVDLNPAAQRLSSRPLAQAIGRLAITMLPPSPLWTAQLESDRVAYFDLVSQQQGDDHVYEAQITPLRDPHGGLAERFIVLRDITERKQIERQLRTSEERFRMLAENAQHIIFRLRLMPTAHFEYLRQN